MLSDERREKMAEWICREGRADIAELAAYFGVSGETIRRDLGMISDGQKIKKVHGGAIAIRRSIRDESYAQRRVHNSLAKKKIGIRAARLLEDNDVIAVDSGTNAESFAQAVYHVKNLKIMTYSIPVATLFAKKLAAGDFTGSVILLSGTIAPETLNVYGSITTAQIRNYHFTKAFLAATAISEEGVMTGDENDAQLTVALLHRADQAFVLAESEKFGKQSFCHVATFDELTGVITDDEHPVGDGLKNQITSSGAAFMIASTNKEDTLL